MHAGAPTNIGIGGIDAQKTNANTVWGLCWYNFLHTFS